MAAEVLLGMDDAALRTEVGQALAEVGGEAQVEGESDAALLRRVGRQFHRFGHRGKVAALAWVPYWLLARKVVTPTHTVQMLTGQFGAGAAPAAFEVCCQVTSEQLPPEAAPSALAEQLRLLDSPSLPVRGTPGGRSWAAGRTGRRSPQGAPSSRGARVPSPRRAPRDEGPVGEGT